HVAAGIRRSATRHGFDEQARQRIDSCADYLLKYKKNMKYNEYLNMGLPIATGVIEGACRYLVKDRMDRTGARWSLTGASRAASTCAANQRRLRYLLALP